jgi:N-succinyldiaminopimelate aminotransferase
MTRRNPPLVPALRPYERTVFGEMSALAASLGAVNLGQGFPDRDGPEDLKEAAIAAIRDGRGNQYPPAHGVPLLREAIAAHQQRWYGLRPDWRTGVVVTTGASEALVATVMALVEPGDEVIVLDPYFDLYAAAIAIAGGVRVAVPLGGTDLRPDLGAMAAAVTDRSRMILVNSPHNPTGMVLDAAERAGIADIAVANDLFVVSDEAYEHLWFDQAEHVPMATLPGMWERTVTVGSAGKMFSMTGWKVGWATGPDDLIAAVRVVRQHLSYVSGGPFQWAIAGALAADESYFVDLRDRMSNQRDQLAAGLADLGMRVVPSAGTYFLVTDVTPLGFSDGGEFCHWAPTAAGVVAIPLGALSDHPDRTGSYVRWAFCKSPATISAGLERLAAGLRGWERRRNCQPTIDT